MLTGAFFGVLVATRRRPGSSACSAPTVGGRLLALIHAFFSIHLRADQIVSGFGINILALGGTSYLFRSIYGTEGTPEIDRIPDDPPAADRGHPVRRRHHRQHEPDDLAGVAPSSP